MIRKNWVVMVMGLMLLGGCATHMTRPSSSNGELSPPQGLQASPRVERARALPPAALALAGDADRAAAMKNWSLAARDLERAIGIAPHSALLWQRLAAVRYSQGEYHQVEALAHKSNTLAGNDAAIRRINWRMIGAAREALGNHEGAVQAEKRAAGIGP